MKCATHVEMLDDTSNNLSRVHHAFTLAEVLITLGIIGVVAAMTLPTLINNYQKSIYETSFKKSVNLLLNGHKMLFAQEEVDSLCDLQDMTCEIEFDGVGIREGHQDDYMKKLGLTKKKADLGKTINDFYGDEYYVSKNGSCFIPYNLFGSMSSDTGAKRTFEIFVDTNCEKKPNKGGRDQFFIIFDEDVRLVSAENTDDWANKETCSSLAGNSEDSLAVHNYGALYCGLYLIGNSYKMDY